MKTIKQILMDRDKLNKEEAEDLISEAKEALQEYLLQGNLNNAEDICAEYFGLEPDYLEELIPY